MPSSVVTWTICTFLFCRIIFFNLPIEVYNTFKRLQNKNETFKTLEAILKCWEKLMTKMCN